MYSVIPHILRLAVIQYDHQVSNSMGIKLWSLTVHGWYVVGVRECGLSPTRLPVATLPQIIKLSDKLDLRGALASIAVIAHQGFEPLGRLLLNITAEHMLQSCSA